MQATARRDREWIWLAALLLLVSLHFWFPRVSRGPRHDSYSTSAEGKKAFYLLVRDQGYAVSRNQQGLPALLDALGDPFFGPATLCLLGPARYPTQGEWERIMDWVHEGGRLLVAARSGQGGEKLEFEIPQIDVAVKQNSGAFETIDVETRLPASGRFIWQSGGEIDLADQSGAAILIETGGNVQAARVSYGLGEVVVVASDFVFSNQSLAWRDYSNAELALRLLQAADAGGEIAIDESLNSSGTPKVVGLLLEPFLRPVTIQLLVVLLLFAWWKSRPFGALWPRSVKARHNIVDHTDTLGLLYFKSDNGTAAVKSYLTQLESEMRLGAAPGAEERILGPVAARLGKSVSAVSKVFRRARHYADAPYLDRKSAAKIIHRLALIRRAMNRPPRKTARPATDD